MSKKRDKNIRKILISSALIGLIAPEGALAGPVSCNTSNISISTKVTTMAFGTVTPCTASAGSVTLAPAKQTVSTTGCIQGTAGTPAAAVVKVASGQASGVKVQVKVSTGTINITRTAGAQTMTVLTFDLSLKGGGPTVTLVGNLTRTIPIGATLKVGANQTAGSYKGAFSVTAKCL